MATTTNNRSYRTNEIDSNDRDAAYHTPNSMEPNPIALKHTSLSAPFPSRSHSDRDISEFSPQTNETTQIPFVPIPEKHIVPTKGEGASTMSIYNTCTLGTDACDDTFSDSPLYDSECEPSPSLTPIISDLDDLLEESPIPMPSPLTETQSETPRPDDTHDSQLSLNISNFISPEKEFELKSVDETDSVGSSDFDVDDIPTFGMSHLLSDRINMSYDSAIAPHRHQTIKSFSPMTQQMASRQIFSHFERRRSVQNVSDSMHRTIALDADLEEIRIRYIEQREEKQLWSGGLVMLTENEIMEIPNTPRIEDEEHVEQTEQLQTEPKMKISYQ